MATVFQFPSAEALASPPSVPGLTRCGHARHAVDILWWARQLKMLGRPSRAIIKTIRLLVTEGAPEPRSPRYVKGVRQRGPEAVWAKSIWDRDEAELWFFDDLPPAAAQASAAANRTATRHRLAERARQVAGVAA